MQRLVRSVPAFAAAGLLALACGGTTPPRAELSAAEAALRSAETAQAHVHATAQWNAARDTLARAQEAMDEEAYHEARRLAERALVDAELATAVARSETQRRDAEALQETIRDLRDEATRAGERMP